MIWSETLRWCAIDACEAMTAAPATPPKFHDRVQAGRLLATRLAHLRTDDAIVLGIASGGVPVAGAIAQQLELPLDVLNVRKLRVPGHEHLTMGAIATGGTRTLHDVALRACGVTPEQLNAETARESRELARRDRFYRRGHPAVPLRNRTVLLVDDGIASGSTARTAIAAVRTQRPRAVVLVVPVVQASTAHEFAMLADELVTLKVPATLGEIADWYDDFAPLTDDTVRSWLSTPLPVAHHDLP